MHYHDSEDLKRLGEFKALAPTEFSAFVDFCVGRNDPVEDRPRDLLIRTDRYEGEQVRLTVKDVGVGFKSEAGDKLFKAFFTTKKDGMGIGLSISHSIIESHNGRLWATPNDGPGATFQFTLPIEAKASATSTA